MGGAHPLVIGLIIKEVSAQSTNENWVRFREKARQQRERDVGGKGQ